MKKLINTWLLLVLAMGLFGCSDYTTERLYRTDVDTVYVEMLESQSFHREIEFELTRALCQQLELHSPFKVVSSRGKADSILYGRINNISEKVLIQERELDRPMENRVTMTVSVTWKDLRNGDFLLDNQHFEAGADYAVLLAAGRTSAQRQAANDLAVRIVEAMEQPW